MSKYTSSFEIRHSKFIIPFLVHLFDIHYLLEERTAMNRHHLIFSLHAIFLFVYYSPLPCQAQLSGGIFEHITSAQGLSSNKVNEIIQDRDGFYWIATADGLNRFDGSEFKVFRNENNNIHSL